jgi:hypothetical protein
LIAAFLAVLASPVWAEDLEPDEGLVMTNSYGEANEQLTLRVSLSVYDGPAGHYVEVPNKQNIELPCVGSTLIYPGHFQYTYSKVIDGLTPGGTYYGDIEMKLNGVWIHLQDTASFHPGPP